MKKRFEFLEELVVKQVNKGLSFHWKILGHYVDYNAKYGNHVAILTHKTGTPFVGIGYVPIDDPKEMKKAISEICIGSRGH